MTAVFNGEGSGTRGDLQGGRPRDPARPGGAQGDRKADPAYGRLRHPAQFIANILRAFDARSADGTSRATAISIPRALPWEWTCSARRRCSATSAPSAGVPGGGGLRGPEFGILSTSTALARLNFVNTIVFSRINVGTNAPERHVHRLLAAAAARRPTQPARRCAQ